MKKIFTLALITIAFASNAQPLNTRNIVVTRVGDGTTALSTNTAPVNLLEFSPVLANQSTPLKTTVIGSTASGSRLTFAGTTNSTAFEGQLNLSSDARYLSLIGYDVPAGELATNTGISAIAISAGGTGYTFAATVTISAPNLTGGVQATAIINNIVSGAIAGIIMTNVGSGYTAAPTITITSAAGTGFVAGAITRVPYWQGFNNKKVIGRIDNAGTVNYSTSFPSSSSNSSGAVKNVASVDGSKYWICGGRVEYVDFGQTTSATQVISAGARSIGIFNNQLYYNLGFNTAGFLYSNTSLPEATSTTTALPLAMSGAGSSPAGFVFLDMDPSVNWNATGYDVLYVCESSGGLEKYYWDGTNWTPANSKYMPLASPLNNHISFGSGAAITAITATRNSLGNPVIYVISGNGNTAENGLYAIVDAAGRTNAMVTPTNTTVTTLATSGTNYVFKGVAFAPSLFTLPVQLTSFNGSLVNNKTVLKWTIASGTNAQDFIVERSSNNVDFIAIGNANPKNGSDASTYTFEDGSLITGTNYYRLKTVNKEGSFVLSNVVAIKAGGAAIAISIFPNPVKNNLTVIHPKAAEDAVIKITGVDGKIMSRCTVAKNATQTSVDVSALLPGQYIVSYKGNGVPLNTAFVK